MSPRKVWEALLGAETSGCRAPDCRRVMRGERQALGLLLDGPEADPVRARSRAGEAIETAALWGIDLRAVRS